MRLSFVIWGLIALAVVPSLALAERLSILDNGQVRLGVDLDAGGTITLLAGKDGVNLINSHDLGRQVQQSYYSGPQPFGMPHPHWKDWAWNPIGSGDVYGHPSKVVAHQNDGKTIHVQTIPMQWALNNVAGECTFESWITLNGPTAHVRNRLNNRRPDKTQYPARTQELPAVYTVGTHGRLFTYDGPAPFTGGPLRQVENAGPPWAYWTATENWAALVDDHKRGLGIFQPGVYSFAGGFHGTPDQGGPKDDSTGYIAPLRSEILDHNIVYDDEYTLILDSLDEIRAYATAHRILDTRPRYRFVRDRMNWTYVNASDAGFPLDGALRVKLDRDDPQMIGPEQWWAAQDAPRLFILAAYRTKQTRAEVFWSVAGKTGFSDERYTAFTILPDGEFHTYEVDLAAAPTYRGTITGLRFDPVPAGQGDDEVKVAWISWRRE